MPKNAAAVAKQKQCSKCAQLLPETPEFFYYTPGGKKPKAACKKCSNVQNAVYSSAHQKQIREYNKAWYATHREEQSLKTKLHREQYPEKIIVRRKAYRATHLEEIKSRARAYNLKNRQKLNEKARASREKNRSRIRARQKRYTSKHMDHIRVKVARRRATKRNAVLNDLTGAQWGAIKAHYGHRCVYCGKKPGRLTQDHLTPLSRGGNHTASNVVPSCQSCNSKKGTGPVLKPVQPLLFVPV
mgnify:CR=1 FL=1